MPTEDDEEEGSVMTRCDRCACEVSLEDSSSGPAGSEWESTQVCGRCYAEIEDED
jgi:hypothetical protein